MDLDRPLEEQGPFDLIIQKITDYMAAATEGDEEAIKTLKGVEVMYFTLSLSSSQYYFIILSLNSSVLQLPRPVFFYLQ